MNIRSVLTVLAIGLALIAAPAVAAASPSHAGHAAVVEAAAVPAVPAKADATVSSTCYLSFGGGMVRADVIASRGDGGYATVTVAESSTVPRPIRFDWNNIIDGYNAPWHGITSLNYHERKVWVAYDVWMGPGTVISLSAHDARGNGDWNTCPISSSARRAAYGLAA